MIRRIVRICEVVDVQTVSLFMRVNRGAEIGASALVFEKKSTEAKPSQKHWQNYDF